MVSLLIDFCGSASYLVPGVGEVVDVVFWAHCQTILLMALYDATSPKLKYLSFVEELLPFTDICPSATIGWLAEFAVPQVSAHLFGSAGAAATNRNQQEELRAMVQVASRFMKQATAPPTSNAAQRQPAAVAQLSS